METITPIDLKNLGNTTEQHKHEWAFYDGCIGYESLVCLKCGIDINDLKDKLTPEQLSNIQ